MSSHITRRGVLRAGLYASASIGPWVVSADALASSGSIHVLINNDSLPDPLFRAFAERSGVEVRVSRVDTNRRMLDQMRSGGPAGTADYDLCTPSASRAHQWMDAGLLAAWDFSRLDHLDNVHPALLTPAERDWSRDDQGPHWLPSLWGSEGLAWRTDTVDIEPGSTKDLDSDPFSASSVGSSGVAPDTSAGDRSLEGIVSYGQIWNEAWQGRVVARPRSVLFGAALYLEHTGELEPGAVWSSYESEEKMKAVWDRVTWWCIQRKQQFKRFWTSGAEQSAALRSGDVAVAQVWDTPMRRLARDGLPVAWQAPVEGALSWVDGFSLARNARNLDALYALMDFCLTPEAAGQAIDYHGYNSAVAGAAQHASADYREFFELAYPGDALDRLRPWPSEPQWFAVARVAYRNRFINA